MRVIKIVLRGSAGRGWLGAGSGLYRQILPMLFLLGTGMDALAQSPAINPGGIVNAASYAAGAPLAPGSIAAAFGTFPLSSPITAFTSPLPLSMGGMSLELGDGQSAPLFFVSAGEVNFQVPWELAGAGQTSVTPISGTLTGTPVEIQIAPFAPAIFSINAQGTGQGAITDSSYKVVDSSNPAVAGATIVLIYATGLGAVTNQPASGGPSPADPLARTTTTPAVMIGGAPAAVQFSGLAPGLVGVYQVNALVPAASSTGNSVPVSVSIGGVSSNSVTIAVGAVNPPNPTPSIISLDPSSGAPGTASIQLTINGSGFVSSSTVTFNGQSVPSTLAGASKLSVTIPASDLTAAGSFPIAVSNPSPGGGSSNQASFLVQAGFGSGAASSIAWSGYARDVRHTAISLNQSQPLARIRWSTPVDLQPQYVQNELLIHYGSPLVTAGDTVIVPVKTGATSGFRVDARSAADGTLVWSQATDYVLPPHDWVPEFAPTLTPASRLYFPGAGGTVYFRDAPDSASGAQGQIAFYGLANYQANPQPYNSNVMISTPITSDSSGNIYFGFVVTGATPLQLQSGIARIDSSGQGTWMSAEQAAGDTAIAEVAQNCAPAVNEELGILYVGVSNGAFGYLVALNSTTLQPMGKVLLRDPRSGLNANVSDDGTASPTIGVDGDVYYGVLENPIGSNHERGWLLHFDSQLSQSKAPGAFGWDDTASLVPGFMAPSYTGASPYLLMTKYNDYADGGGSGQNRIAILDPNATETDPVTGAAVMKEILTILGTTPNNTLPGVKEWCINSAAVDPATSSVLAGSEDGKLYRWDLRSNTFSQTIVLTPGIGEAYTPTLIGPDGTVYAINNATLFVIGQ